MQYLDLSRLITNNMPVHPLDEPVRLYLDKFIDKDFYNNTMIHSGMHIGTHMDAPSHLTKRTEKIPDLPLQLFAGHGRIIDARGQTEISAEPQYDSLIQPGEIVLLFTGFDKHFDSEFYYTEHPYIDESFARLLIRSGTHVFGMDTPSPDRLPYSVHKMLCENGLVIIENLTNLDKLVGVPKFEVFAFPLLIDAEASPVRVVARY